MSMGLAQEKVRCKNSVKGINYEPNSMLCLFQYHTVTKTLSFVYDRAIYL